MRGDEVAGVENIPKRIGNEVRLQGARVPPQLFIAAGKDALASRTIPLNLHGAVGIEPRRIENHRPARVIVAHHEIEHRVIQRAIAAIRVQQVAVVGDALLLGGFISQVSLIAVQKGKRGLCAQNVRSGEREIFHREAILHRHVAVVGNRADNRGTGRQ